MDDHVSSPMDAFTRRWGFSVRLIHCFLIVFDGPRASRAISTRSVPFLISDSFFFHVRSSFTVVEWCRGSVLRILKVRHYGPIRDLFLLIEVRMLSV